MFDSYFYHRNRRDARGLIGSYVLVAFFFALVISGVVWYQLIKPQVSQGEPIRVVLAAPPHKPGPKTVEPPPNNVKQSSPPAKRLKSNRMQVAINPNHNNVVDELPAKDSSDRTFAQEGNGRDEGGVPGGTSDTGSSSGRDSAPPPPPPLPKIVPAVRIKSEFQSGEEPHLSHDVLVRYRSEGMAKGAYKVCIALSGQVSSVDVVSGIIGADDSIIEVLKDWKYKPQQIPVCFIQNLKFIID